jgi:hypothetical protein
MGLFNLYALPRTVRRSSDCPVSLLPYIGISLPCHKRSSNRLIIIPYNLYLLARKYLPKFCQQFTHTEYTTEGELKEVNIGGDYV